MTKINKIVMQGFKSFGKHTEIPFGSKFNVVLGPNGSGKSNVTDAICFVLGKLSAKGLRAERQANLIYNGGKNNPPAKNAVVSIFFDNSDKVFPYPEKEVIVSRKVLQNGNSLYRINNKSCSRKDVIDLISLARIDPNGYNIILQGDIDKFTEMSSEKRREVVEEISEISLYEDKKHEALLELARVDDKLKEAKIVLTERKTYLDELKTEHDQAVKYREMRDKIGQNKATYVHLQIINKKKNLEELEKKADKLKSEMDATQAKIKQLEDEIGKAQGGIDKVNAEIEQKGEKGQVDLQKEMDVVRAETATNTARVEACKQEINNIKQRKEQLTRQHVELNEKLEALTREAEALKQDKVKLAEEQAELQKKLDALKKKYKMEDTSKLEGEIESLDREAEQLTAAMLEQREKQQTFMLDKDRYEIQLANIAQRIEKIAEIEKGNKEELGKLKDSKNRFKQVTVELNKLITEDSGMAARLASLREHLMAAREELAKINERKSSLNEKIAGNIAVKRVLELRGKMPIFGTVSSLGSVQSKYALALDVAAGSRLRDVVVEDDATATKCIKFLKEERLGIATFLPLNKLRANVQDPEIRKMAKATGVHGFAIDLIKYDPKFEKVFRYVFRDTLVVDNIDVARRLGIGSARMVTIDGDIVELSGAMIGGYRHVKKESLGFQEDEVSKYLSDSEARVDELQSQISKLENVKAASEERIASLKREKANLEGEIIKAEKSLHLESEDLSASAKEREILQANLRAAQNGLKEVGKVIGELTGAITSKKMAKEKLRAQLTALRSPNVLGELNTYEERLRKIQGEMVAIDGHIKNNKLQSDEVFGKELGRVAQVLKQLDKEAGQFTDELAEKSKKNKTLTDELAAMEKRAEAFYSKYKELFKTRNGLAERVRELDVEKAGLIERVRQNELTMNSFSLDKATAKAQLAGLEEEFSQYKDMELLPVKSMTEVKKEIDKFEALMATFGAVNLKSLEIYDQVEHEYNRLLEKREKLLKEKEDVEKMMAEIEAKKKDLFMQSFNKLNQNFRDFFGKLSTKGDAYLILENEENPFAGGVEIKVRISGNKFLDLRGLSGGEKALTALALIFAIQEFEPATFYIMDEVDAALDKQNSEKLAKLIANYSQKAQYIVVSHNDYIIQEGDTLFGVSMAENGISKLVSLRV